MQAGEVWALVSDLDRGGAAFESLLISVKHDTKIRTYFP